MPNLRHCSLLLVLAVRLITEGRKCPCPKTWMEHIPVQFPEETLGRLFSRSISHPLLCHSSPPNPSSAWRQLAGHRRGSGGDSPCGMACQGGQSPPHGWLCPWRAVPHGQRRVEQLSQGFLGQTDNQERGMLRCDYASTLGDELKPIRGVMCVLFNCSMHFANKAHTNARMWELIDIWRGAACHWTVPFHGQLCRRRIRKSSPRLQVYDKISGVVLCTLEPLYSNTSQN